jgi:orotate phosphoribosyltransferase-like protein
MKKPNEIILLYYAGLQTKEIASTLQIEMHTVHNAITNHFKGKAFKREKDEAMIKAKREELIGIAQQVKHDIHTIADVLYIDKETLYLHDSQQYLYFDQMKNFKLKNVCK